MHASEIEILNQTLTLTVIQTQFRKKKATFLRNQKNGVRSYEISFSQVISVYINWWKLKFDLKLKI